MVKVSICIATRNKELALDRTLHSIRRQSPKHTYELIVADDGSSDDTEKVCREHQVDKYVKLTNILYRNPSKARNAAYRLARGEVVICQSDDVIHATPDAIDQLVDRLHPDRFLIAEVCNWDVEQDRIHPHPMPIFTGPKNKRPFFFLGSLWRHDLWAVGGNDERFIAPAFEDDWFADCLMLGIGLEPEYTSSVTGRHQHHDRPANIRQMARPSRMLLRDLRRRAAAGEIPYQSAEGPWQWQE